MRGCCVNLLSSFNLVISCVAATTCETVNYSHLACLMSYSAGYTVSEATNFIVVSILCCCCYVKKNVESGQCHHMKAVPFPTGLTRQKHFEKGFSPQRNPNNFRAIVSEARVTYFAISCCYHYFLLKNLRRKSTKKKYSLTRCDNAQNGEKENEKSHAVSEP